ncbi:ankyrin repeat-containing domain protein [Dactylonectria estremocensis]|uniref:Ankyrin repeat-containing domain protein n=1 Tax=Dactylonectria estremocensis TaxID=1079267 RepID=A0A9P9F0R5_9HYPO|nr:ankyrin repeat-containing domain protein [Dactylonectria estremocensis]
MNNEYIFLVRLAKSVFSAGGENYMQQILSKEDEVLKLAQLHDTETLHFIETAVLRLRDQSNNNTRLLDEESHMKMILWLSTLPFPTHHETISESRTPNFGQWLLKHDKYQEWCETSSSCALWLHGIMGSGKTHLFSVVIDSLLATTTLHPNSTPFAYFYCLSTDSEPERSSADGILRSLLRQLTIGETQNQVRGFLSSEFERRAKAARLRGLDVPRLTRKECVDLIIEVANEDPVTILLDAADQIQEDHRCIVLECLDRVMVEAANVVKVFVTSRNDNEVPLAFPTAIEIIITGDNTHDDMVEFIFQKTNDARLLGGNLSSQTRDSLANALLNGAGEMFLWAQHQIQQLRKIKREEDLLPALETNILSDLDKLYEDDLSQILLAGSASRQLAIQIFSWLLYMKAPLTSTALVAAITTASIDPVALSPADVSALCSNLVMVDTDREVIRFAHQSIQEYLLRANQSLFSPTVAHTMLASTCIKASSRGPPGMEDLVSRLKEFYFYAATHWATHFRSAQVVNQDEELFKEMVSFVFEEEDWDVSLSFEVWLNICRDIARLLPRDDPMRLVLDAIPNDESSPLFLAAVFGMDGLLTLLAEPDQDTDWNQRNEQGHTAIYLTAAFGHVSSVSILIDKGAEVNIECGALGSPLHAACFRGHEEVVVRLLQAGASSTCGAKFENALEAASRGRRENVVLALVRSGSAIKSETDYEQAVQMAAEYGFSGVIDELRKPSFASFGEKDTPNRQKARMAKAIKGGQLAVLQIKLLGDVPDPSALLPKDAVAIAAFYGHVDVIDFLLSKGMSIEAEGQFGTPLRSSSLMNRKSTVQFLLQRGVNVKTGEAKGNALYVSAVKDHADIARMLMAEGADVNQKTGRLGTVLQAAAYHGHKSIVNMFLEAGADVHAKGHFRDAFHAAADGGHQEIIMMLLERGYKFRHTPPGPMCLRASPSRYRQLFRDSSPGRHNHPGSKRKSKNFKMTRENEDHPVKTETDETSDVSWSAAFEGHQRPSFAHSENYPLEASAAAGHQEVVEILLAQKGTLGIRDAAVRNALGAAVVNGHMGTVQLLFASVADDGPIEDCISLILNKAKREDREMVEYALGKAFESGCTEDEVNQMRLKLRPGPEKYKVTAIKPKVLRSDLIASCTAGDADTLLSILDCKHYSLLQAKDVAEGLQCAAKNGRESLLALWFDHRSFQQDPIIPDEALISAAGSGLNVFKLLHSRRQELLGSSDVLGRATYEACTKGNPEVLEYLVSSLGVDVNTEVPEVKKPIANKWASMILRIPSSPGDSSSGESDSGDPSSDESSSERPSDGYDLEESSSHESGSSSSSSGSSSPEFPLPREVVPEPDAERIALLKTTRLFSPLQAALRGFKPKWSFEKPTLLGRKEFSKHEEIVQLLLRHGADPNCLGGQDAYPIQFAARFCPDLVVKDLLDAGANASLVQNGDSALASAVKRELESFAITKRLLEARPPLPDDCSRRKQMLDMVLTFFKGDAERNYYHDCDDPDGCFLHAPSLKYVFEEGPGAVLELLLRSDETEKLDDIRYCLVLQMACFLGRKGLVQVLITRGVNVNGTGYYYGCPIQAAARTGQTAIVKILLEAGADINVLQGRWHTPLRAAIVGGYSAIVQLLIDQGADVKLRYKTERLYVNDSEKSPPTALQLALQDGNLDICKALLAADPTLIDDESHLPHPLIMACQKGDIEMATLLLEANVSPSIQGKKREYYYGIEDQDASPLHAAVAGGHVTLVEMLLVRGAEVNMEVNQCPTPLITAVENADLRMVRRLLDAGADVNCISDSGTALSRASGSKANMAVLKELIAAGATVVGPSPHPNCIKMACYEENLDTIDLLLDTLCSTSEHSDAFIDEALEAVTRQAKQNDKVIRLLLDYVRPTPKRFLQVCSSGSVSLVTYMLQQGMDVNGDEREDESPIQAAARHLSSGVVELLIQQGADVRSKWCQQRGPLVAALKSCAGPLLRRLEGHRPYYRGETSTLEFRHVQQCTDIVRLLLKNGAAVDVEEGDFGNPLHLACLIGSPAIVQLLVDHGLTVNDVGGYFETPLFAAMQGSNSDVELLILDNGVEVNHVHKTFGTALHFACKRVDQTLVRHLLQYGASAAVPNREGETALSFAFKIPRYRYSGESLSTIILQASKDIEISDHDILVAASSTDKDLVASLLEARKDKSVSEDLIVGYLRESRWPDGDTLKLLFDRSGGLGITEGMLMTGPSNMTLEALLEINRPLCKITAEILENQSDLTTMEMLLEHDQNINITEGVIIRVLQSSGSYDSRSSSGTELAFIKTLWERNPSLVVTQRMIKAAKSKSKLEFLLQRLDLAQGTLEYMATFICEKDFLYYDDQAGMLACIIRSDPEIKLTLRMVEKVMIVGGATPLDTFLTHDPNLEITENLFISIFGTFPTAREAQRMEFADILHRHGKRIVFTQKMRDAVDKAYQKQTDKDSRERFYRLRERDETPEEAEAREREMKNERSAGDSDDGGDGTDSE